MTIENDPITDHVLRAKGITSEVKDDREIIGHVLLLDYDDHSASFNRLMDDCANLPGLTAVFESSPGSWHVWNTTIRTFNDTALQMLRHKCDPMHVSVGYRRGRWTLRYGDKRKATDTSDRYKASPECIEWWVNRTGEDQSQPHINLIEEQFGDFIRRDGRIPYRVGSHKRMSSYRTMTDELKGYVKNG